MEFWIRKATIDDLKLLSQMNKELIEDEGSRNPMTLAQLEDRFLGWLSSDWEISLFEKDSAILGYAVYQISADVFYPEESNVYLRQYHSTATEPWLWKRSIKTISPRLIS
ncbi:hypothetical protein BK120_20090 [Paenibacillus sp. FSL A5-0031]|uniref:hypothetical protein n=1 Tax=Paenibacillus sp. FSL A5-0031 TaxID=1920420 RepID=UPI00096FA967|nr:hypothetical protein [Paenibacillus sp. FSL A5-0031]OME80137.1 hypothetical protein BK120_20090 [Paenibacillus sp. FSL A5-0031]